MRIMQPKSKIKIIGIVLGCLILIASVVTATAYYLKMGPFAVNPQDIQTKQENQTGKDIKKQSIDNSSKGNQNGSDPSPAPQPIPDNTKSAVGAEITSTTQDDNYLHVRILVQTVTNSGICTLTLSGSQQKSYSTSVGVQALPSTSTCKGFDIPLSQLSQGAWKINVIFNNDTLTASVNKNIIIQ